LLTRFLSIADRLATTVICTEFRRKVWKFVPTCD
jgi:hypothetical protein